MSTQPEGMVASLVKLLNAQATRAKQQQCSNCLTDMKFLEGLFWIPGAEVKCQISLPICPTCESELWAQQASSQRIQ